MDNRHDEDNLPDGYLRNAVNTVFDDLGNAKLVSGATKVYSGSAIHSFWQGYFIEGSNLKRLNSDFTATTLLNIGSNPVGYTKVGDRVFCGNGLGGYVIYGDTAKSLGIAQPEQQPFLIARDTGGMFAGDYQVAITYMRDGEESGCGTASRITVSDGGGIYFIMPTVPADIDTVAVYVSSVNGDELYLYDEVNASTTEVFIDNNISSIRLETQHMYQPILSDILTAHYGRLYWVDGDLLRFTEAQKYGLTKSGNYTRFGGDISIIASVPGALYVCADRTYRIGNIDGDGFSQRVEVLPYGAVKGTLRYDERSKTAYWQSHKGFVAANLEGIQEMVADVIALPEYEKGTMTIAEMNGVRQLISVSQGGTASSLADSKYKSDEVARKGNSL
jgi:hypothetical protein